MYYIRPYKYDIKYYYIKDIEEDVKNEINKNIITDICQKGDIKALKIRIDMGVSLEKHLTTALYTSCQNGHMDMVQFIMENGGNRIRSAYMFEHMLLIISCITAARDNEHLEIVEYLKEAIKNTVYF